MRIGFIGAGKVGFTLGKYMTVRGADVSGYYSLSEESAKEAADFTHTKYYAKLEDIVSGSDALFLTCPDGAVENVWNLIKRYSLKGKCICHCSGSLSSAVFSEINLCKAYGYSIHPLLAISSKRDSYRNISKAYFTIEGHEKYLNFWSEFFAGLGNPVKIISAENKALYHGAAVFVSNLVCGLFEEGISLMRRCGFDEDEARLALGPMLLNNAQSLAELGPVRALTGPVERGDALTIKKHLEALSGREKIIYKALSETLIDIGKVKHPEKDYTGIYALLSENVLTSGDGYEKEHSDDL